MTDAATPPADDASEAVGSASYWLHEAEFLAAYQSRLKEIVDFLQTNRLVTIPPYIGQFLIRELPEAFKPTSPGGFMNAPGVYDKDPDGFYYIPTYNPKSDNSISGPLLSIRVPYLGTRAFPVTSCRSRSPIMSPARSAACRPTGGYGDMCR